MSNKFSTHNKTGSITRKTLINIAVTMALAIGASTAISYFNVLSNLKSQNLDQLEKYVIERGQRENSLFTLAEDNHAVFKQELLRRLQESGNQDPKVQFDQLLIKFNDGVIRNRPEKFNGKRQSGVYIGKSVTLNADIRRRVLTFYDMTKSYGSAWHNRFQDTYIITPENMAVIYWPEVPNWAQDAKANFYIPNEEYVVIADKQHNPTRKTVWTGLFYDKVSKLWMVSVTTPVDLNGRHIANIGHDVLVNELLKRTIDNHIDGGYNLIFREDGRLIAHPKLMDKIQEKNGVFNILESDDTHIKNIFQSVKNKSANQVIIDNAKDDEYLAVTKLEGPDWYFVTVFPKSILTNRAMNIARVTLFLGLALLVIVVAVVFVILRKQIAAPLKELTDATNQIAAGDFNISLEYRREDELGRLAHSFNLMTKEIEARTRELQSALEQQATSVHETTITMDELGASSRSSAEQAEAAAAGANQVLNLVNGSNYTEDSSITREDSLRAKVEQIAQEILRLSEQTHQIGMISSLVSNLANQTNMLALNAAVEAVRAGEHGRGFGVVASEIRKLADQSKQSAERINDLVRAIHSATNSTVMVTDEGRKTVENVVAAINNITVSSQQISLNAKQQAIAIQQVVSAMNALNQGAALSANMLKK